MKSNILKGSLFIIFGVLILFNLSVALKLLATWFGILAIAGGLISLAGAWQNHRKGLPYSAWLAEGILGLAVGILIVSFPQKTVSLFMFIFGIYALIIGIIQLNTYRHFKDWNLRSGTMLISAILSFLIAAVLLFKPFESAGLIAAIIAIYAIFYGITLLINTSK